LWVVIRSLCGPGMGDLKDVYEPPVGFLAFRHEQNAPHLRGVLLTQEQPADLEHK